MEKCSKSIALFSSMGLDLMGATVGIFKKSHLTVFDEVCRRLVVCGRQVPVAAYRSDARAKV